MGLAILETFTRLTRDAPVDLVVGTQDMKSAYRQLPVSHDQQRFSIIAIWHVHRKCWVFGELHAMAFGLFNA
eukprot:3409781-Karenia_brevis.AAC.1